MKPEFRTRSAPVERWFPERTTKQIRRGVHRTVTEWKSPIEAFIDAYNSDPKPYAWTKSAGEIRASISRFTPRTPDAQAKQFMSRTTVAGH